MECPRGLGSVAKACSYGCFPRPSPEGAQHLYQFQERWITYRSTAAALKHERYLYLAKAGPYLRAGRHQQLATGSSPL
ncbi:DUF4231 domain-containing protein [Arthrobacter sp. C152]